MFEADASGRLLVTLADLGEIAAALAPEEAAEALDAMVAEVFFRDWPAIYVSGRSRFGSTSKSTSRRRLCRSRIGGVRKRGVVD
ncbi:MAG: hypothetical protein U0W40_18460 [Acidimicrobiia bacterium]